MQTLLEMMDSQFLGNTAQDYLVSAVVFLGVLVVLPIAKALILRHLKAVSQRTANDLDDLLHDLLRRIVGQFVYLSTALYCATLFLTLPDSLDGPVAEPHRHHSHDQGRTIPPRARCLRYPQMD